MSKELSDDARSRASLLVNLRQDLVTPVNSIIEFSDLLLQDARDRNESQLESDLLRIHEAGHGLHRMIHETLARAEGGESWDAELQSKLRHDLRTPLTHIVGYCEMLIEDAEDEDRSEAIPDLSKMLSAARDLLGRIDDLLDFARQSARPVAPAIPPLPPVAPHSEPPAKGKQQQHGKILVVDDNPTNRELLSRRLTREGHQVSTVGDGRAAIDCLTAEEFDLVLLDIMMPEMDGMEVLERLKSDEQLRHIPVIMISALEEFDRVVRCIKMGAEDYLAKPFDPVLLKARIDACLEKKFFRDREVQYLRQIDQERQRSDQLLRVILPDEVVEELKTSETVKPRRIENVSVLFADIVDFTPYCDRHPPEQVVADLQELIVLWEDIAYEHGVEKIKTIGDAFMAAAGLLKAEENPVLHCVRCGLRMIETARNFRTQWAVRVGIHAGPVVAGVLGRKKYLYDLWGDTVNTAARMESYGRAGAVMLSGAAFAQISDRAEGESVGTAQVKGKGEMELVRFVRFKNDSP